MKQHRQSLNLLSSGFMTEAIDCPESDRERMAQVAFESLSFGKFFVFPQPFLMLSATSKCKYTIQSCRPSQENTHTAVCVDLGHSAASVSTMSEGVLQSSFLRIPFAGLTRPQDSILTYESGEDITDHLFSLLRHRYPSLPPGPYLRDLKEKVTRAPCVSVLTPPKISLVAPRDNQTNHQISYRLPDGQSVQIESERWKCTEPLFDPFLLQSAEPSLPRLVHNIIESVRMIICGRLPLIGFWRSATG